MQLELFDYGRDRPFRKYQIQIFNKDIPELEEIIDKLKITKSNLKKEDNFNNPKEKILMIISKNIKTDYKNSLI